MSMTTTLKSNRYDDLAREARTAGTATSKETAEKILADAKGRVHVITGKTRDSGHIVENGIGYDVVFDSPGAVPEELGTVHRPPHPYLTPASEAQRRPYLDRLKRALELQ
jgi:hypothetical protein